jgi:hypothetical protein
VEDSNIHLFSFFQNCFNFSEVKGLFNLWKLSMESIRMTYSVHNTDGVEGSGAERERARARERERE